MPIFVFGTIPSLEDGPEVLWHSIRVDGLFAVYCFGGIETSRGARWYTHVPRESKFYCFGGIET